MISCILSTSHKRAWRIDYSPSDAFSSCALWMAKNPVNAEVILRSIESRVQELIASPMPRDPLETIARTQALLFYQIIRVFDGDVRSSSAAEETTQALEDASFALMDHIFDGVMASSPNPSDDYGAFYPSPSNSDRSQPSSPVAKRNINPNQNQQQNTNPDPNPTHDHRNPNTQLTQPAATNHPHNPQPDLHLQAPDLPLYPLDTARAFWQTWIFQESARRTVLTAGYFLTLHRLMKGEMPDVCGGRLVAAAARHSFTISEHLWSARDPLSFAIAWRSGRRWVVRGMK